MNDSWETFLASMTAECAAFARLNEKALELSQALVENVPDKIMATQKDLESARKDYVAVAQRRRSMQQRGFGKTPLRAICGHAPPHLAGRIFRRASELTHRTISLEIINSNNRALILGQMERLMSVVAVLRRAQAQPLTYKRRGIMPPVEGSMLMSQRA